MRRHCGDTRLPDHYAAVPPNPCRRPRADHARSDGPIGRPFQPHRVGAFGNPTQRATESLLQPSRLGQDALEVCRSAGEPREGRVRISELARQVLAKKPQAINVKFLKQFPSYSDFVGKPETKTDGDGT